MILLIFSKILQNFTNIEKWLRRLEQLSFPDIVKLIFERYTTISCQEKNPDKKYYFSMEKFYFQNVKFE